MEDCSLKETHKGNFNLYIIDKGDNLYRIDKGEMNILILVL